MKLKAKTIYVNIGITIVSILITFTCFEVTLRMGLMDNLSSDKPVWIPPRFEEINKDITKKHMVRSLDNWNRFNDDTDFIRRKDFLRRSNDELIVARKEPGQKRIVILGDSNEWGKGLPYESIWCNKLEKTVKRNYNVTVSNWSFPAWETIDQFHFLVKLMKYFERAGIEHEIDLLMIGFTTNDLNMNYVLPKMFKWHESGLVKTIGAAFPYSTDYFVAHINNLLQRHVLKDYGQANLYKYVYSDENAKLYSRLLKDFSAYCRKKNIPLLFVINNAGSDNMNKVEALLKEAGIAYLDVNESITKKAAGHSPRSLWANPGDSHPGDLIHTVYAEEVFGYLDSAGFFTSDEPLIKYDDSVKTPSEHAILLRLAGMHYKRLKWSNPPGESLLDYDVESLIISR